MQADFSLNTLLAALRQAGCGEPHQIFAGGLRYVPPSATRQVDRAAFEELSAHGFTQGNRFTPGFEDVLHLIDRPETEYFAYARDETGQFGVLVAARGRSAVTVLCRGERVRLRGVSPDAHPVDALVAHLPHCAPAPLRPFSLPQEEFRREEVDDLYDDVPARSRAAMHLDDLLKQPYFGIGQFYAAKHEHGHRVETRDSLSYLDLEAGRVAVELAGTAHSRYINVAPGEPVVLSRKLAGLRSGLDR